MGALCPWLRSPSGTGVDLEKALPVTQPQGRDHISFGTWLAVHRAGVGSS